MKNAWIFLLFLFACKGKFTSVNTISSISIGATNEEICNQTSFLESEGLEFAGLLQDYCIGTHNFVLFQNKLYIYTFTWHEMRLIKGNVFDNNPYELKNNSQAVCATAIATNIKLRSFQEVYKKDIQLLLDSVLPSNPKEKPILFNFAIDAPETNNALLLYTINTIYEKSPALIWKVRNLIPLEEESIRIIE